MTDRVSQLEGVIADRVSQLETVIADRVSQLETAIADRVSQFETVIAGFRSRCMPVSVFASLHRLFICHVRVSQLERVMLYRL